MHGLPRLSRPPRQGGETSGGSPGTSRDNTNVTSALFARAAAPRDNEMHICNLQFWVSPAIQKSFVSSPSTQLYIDYVDAPTNRAGVKFVVSLAVLHFVTA